MSTSKWIDHDPDKYEGPVIGVDEANFSPSIAGDCMVCACYMPVEPLVPGITDSKRLSRPKLRKLFHEITKVGAVYCVVPANMSVINQFGIYDARAWAMDIAIQGILSKAPIWGKGHVTVLLDGINGGRMHLKVPRLFPHVSFKSIVQADLHSYAVGAASIIARNYMDFLFDGYGKTWHGYGMEQDHGTPSEAHKEALRQKGPSPVHRSVGYGYEWWENILQSKELFNKWITIVKKRNKRD